MDLVVTEDDIKAMVAKRRTSAIFPFEVIGASVASIKNRGYVMNADCFIPLDQDIPWKNKDRTVAYKLQSFQPFAALLLTKTPKKQAESMELAHLFLENWLKYVRPPSKDELEGKWKEGQQEKDFLWYDMAVGLRSYRLAYMIDFMMRAREPDLAKLAELIKILDWHRQVLMSDEAFCDHNNHGFYQALGQVAMARRFTDVPGMQEALDQGVVRMEQMLDQQFFPEGVHREHSPGYHWMVMSSLVEAKCVGLLTKEEHILFLNRIEDSMAWFIQPNMRLAAFGDTDARGMQSEETSSTDFVNPHLRYVRSGGRIGLPPTEPLKMFRESGFAVFKTYANEVQEHACYLAQHAGFHSMTHKHADHLTFIWSDKGEEILVDAGRYAYRGKTIAGTDLWQQGFWYSDPERVYVETTRAHNTVEIDGKSYPRRNVKPFGSALARTAQTQNGVYAIESECKHFDSIRHARTLFVNPGRFLIVFDWLKDNKDETHDFRQWFHLAEPLDLKADGNMLTVLRGGEAFLSVGALLPNIALDGMARGQTEPELQGWVSHERGGQILPNWAFAYKASGVNGTCMATLFSLDPATTIANDSTASNSGRKGNFVWADSHGRHKLSFERPATGDMLIAYDVTATGK